MVIKVNEILISIKLPLYENIQREIHTKYHSYLKSSAWSVRIPVIQKESRTHHMSNSKSQDMAPTKEKFGQITCHFECASADNFLTNLIVGQIM